MEPDTTDEIPVVMGPAAEDEIDFSDLDKIIFNIETRDGRQFSLIVGREEGTTLSLTSEHEGDYVNIMDGSGRVVDTRFSGPQAWQFVILRE
jgi:hypothetical protein